MDIMSVFHDLVSRVRDEVEALPRALPPVVLNAHPAGHPNSVAWLLWHTGREMDAQLADLSGGADIWHTRGFDTSAGVSGVDGSIGFGQSSEAARRVTAGDAGPLIDYVLAVCDAVDGYLRTLDASGLDEVIDDSWEPPVTRGVRIVSFINDAFAHLAQVQYVLGTGTARDAL